MSIFVYIFSGRLIKMETKRYLLQLSEDRAKRENSLRMLQNMGADNIELCSEMMNIYCAEMDEGLVALLDEISDIKAREEDECGFLFSK